MLVEAANPLGTVDLTVLDPSVECSAAQILPDYRFIQGNFREPKDIERLAGSGCNILTFEIEHVDTSAVRKQMEANPQLVVHPSPQTIELIQDKYLQKQHLHSHGIALPAFHDTPTPGDVSNAAEERGFGYPLMLKAKRLAYDGRGNAVVRSANDIQSAFQLLQASSQGGGLYVERWVPFTKELAIMVAKSTDGHSLVSYPVVETIQRDNICHVVIAPAQIDGEVALKARLIAEKAVRSLPGAGIFGVELFLLPDGSVLLNEIAPRPHNSGHYTIEACFTSQFEQHLRAITGLPLGDPSMKVGAALMINILGTGSSMGEAYQPCAKALSIGGSSIHWYGKPECRLGRKMGHITITGSSISAVSKAAQPLLAQQPPVPSQLTDTDQFAPLVGIIMGSDSDLPTMKACAEILREFRVPFELTIVSAHRTPDRMVDYSRSAHRRGLRVIIAAAGGAAHLPGMVAALTPLPVVGVPVALKHLDGVDSLYSIVQMPRGVPVATVAINNSTNAALLAIRILGAHYEEYFERMLVYQDKMRDTVLTKVETIEREGWDNYTV
jgi:phosphoribosylaminoimidazole carboxylase